MLKIQPMRKALLLALCLLCLTPVMAKHDVTIIPVLRTPYILLGVGCGEVGRHRCTVEESRRLPGSLVCKGEDARRGLWL